MITQGHTFQNVPNDIKIVKNLGQTWRPLLGHFNTRKIRYILCWITTTRLLHASWGTMCSICFGSDAFGADMLQKVSVHKDTTLVDKIFENYIGDFT